MVREIIAALFFILGIFIFITATIGVNKFKYVLNRMHAAAMGDTLGILSCVTGGIIYYGIDFLSLKLVLIVLFLWFASPVASHLIAKLEMTVNPDASGREYDNFNIDDDGEVK